MKYYNFLGNYKYSYYDEKNDYYLHLAADVL